ncbi:MAG: hypothetical protein ACRCZH_06855 [Cetobacterium sp.]
MGKIFKKSVQIPCTMEDKSFIFIDEMTAEKIKDLLLESQIDELITVKSRGNLFNVSFDNVKDPKRNPIYDYDIFNSQLALGNLTTILNIKKVKQPATMFYGVGEWRDEGSYRLDRCHIVLGSDNTSKLNEFFAQIDLSEAIEDNDYIYLLKNLTKRSRHGSIKRLYTKKTKSSDESRREKLLDMLKPEIFSDDYGDLFIAVSKINKQDLFERKNDSKVLVKFLKDFINYAFSVEEAKI